MMPRFLKFGKRAIQKGPRTKEDQFYNHQTPRFQRKLVPGEILCHKPGLETKSCLHYDSDLEDIGILRAVSTAKRGIERLETERGIISNGLSRRKK